METKVREEIIEWISKTNDEDLLQTLKLIKESGGFSEWYDLLSASEIKSLERGKKDHQAGNTLTSEEFWKRLS